MKNVKKIILYDGLCRLCNGTVDYIIERDKNNVYFFASLQSDVGQKYLEKFNLPLHDFDTFVLIDEDTFHTSSTAALMVAKDLSGWVRFLHPLIYIPQCIRDMFYRLIAKSRYSLFAKFDTCKMPTQKNKHKYLG